MTQAAPPLSVPLTNGWHSRAVCLPSEAFGSARRALSHLCSRLEEVCREEVDKISRAGMIWLTFREEPTLEWVKVFFKISIHFDYF